MLKVSRIKKSFGTKEILKNVSFILEPGNIYGLLGNNGAGKTTLSKIIFQEYSFDSGEINYNNLDISKVDFKEWYFFSENSELPKNIQVKTYLKLIKNLVKMDNKKFDTRKNDIQSFLNINDLLNKNISSLSSGQQKIVSLFICFLIKPKIIFFDEPTANLDVQNKNMIIKTIENMKKPDVIIVIITHLIEEVKNILDHILIMNQGQIIYDNPYDKLENLDVIVDKLRKKDPVNSKGIERYLDEK
ncbi:ABC transporter ATP-binding protein [Spiroplasma endosymbiont of Panorpa germanica]|uniref:ABC transporter ATP-binding protein n=1 Tax=Spiroplasma endosymbiont of Panorpa germanica TaxID=3066314 RepID=UPI0030CD4389